MKTRGYLSAQAKLDALAAANTRTDNVATLQTRPDPPAALTGAQAKIWRDVVATKPAGWFTADTYGLLADYCRAVVKSNEFDKMVTAAMAVKNKSLVTIKKMESAVRMARQNALLVNRLATSMRLTQQSRMHNEKAANDHRDATQQEVGKGELWRPYEG